jgi:hypothetical protein
MGAWDESVFGNDVAADWVGNLADGGTAEQVEELLREVAGLPADEYLESGPGSEARAAAERVRAGKSELVDLWQDAEPADYEAWQAVVADLLTRLA